MLRKIFMLGGTVAAVAEVGSVDSDVTFDSATSSHFLTDDGMVVGVGFNYDGATYVAPLPAAPQIQIPQQVTMRQACIQLEIDGLLDDVEAIVATLPRIYQIEWQRASVVLRDNPLVEMVRQQKAMTPEQIDALFVTASGL